MKKPKLDPDLTIEASLGFFASSCAKSGPLIFGVDEVGRGCLAGPVVAAAAALTAENLISYFTNAGERKTAQEEFDVNVKNSHAMILDVRDSKLVPEPERAPLAEAVKKFVFGYAVAEASVEEIEKINILYASHLAMSRAVMALEKKLGKKADYILVDGHIVPKEFKDYKTQAIIKGDQRCFTIACASIIAKVYRDEMMLDLDSKYPGYGLSGHKGYPTPFHKSQILKLGITPLHRKTFKGVKVESLNTTAPPDHAV